MCQRHYAVTSTANPFLSGEFADSSFITPAFIPLWNPCRKFILPVTFAGVFPARPVIRQVLVLSLIIASHILCAQHAESQAYEYFRLIRNGQYPAQRELPGAEDGARTLGILDPFLSDSSVAVRHRALEFVYRFSSLAGADSLRAGGVARLMRACRDRDHGIRATALDLLTRFERNDFTNSARDTLRQLIRSEVAPLDRLIKLAGYLKLTDLMGEIHPWSQPPHPPLLRWCALQSLARMGQSDAMADIMRRVKRLPVNDDLVYRVFPDLVYTRQPEAINYIIAALRSDETNCLSADTEIERAIPCGYRIMELLAPVIKDFPLESDPGGDLKTRDYATALATVRLWFATNPAYTILHDKY